MSAVRRTPLTNAGSDWVCQSIAIQQVIPLTVKSHRDIRRHLPALRQGEAPTGKGRFRGQD